jgi:hypothetical protein
MDHNTGVVEPRDSYAEVPDSMRPPSTYPKWPFYLAGFTNDWDEALVIGVEACA